MIPLALFGPVGPWELVAILAIVVFLFGARRIPGAPCPSSSAGVRGNATCPTSLPRMSR